MRFVKQALGMGIVVLVLVCLMASSINPPAPSNVGILPCIGSGCPSSFSASSKFAASSTTDNVCLYGNGTTKTYLYEIRLSGIQTTAGITNVEVVKRSAAETGGTSATPAVVPDDSNYSAANSALTTYTGTGPTPGTAVGDIDNVYVGILTATTISGNDIYIPPFSWQSKPITLNSTSEGVCMNLGGAVSGGSISVTYRWIEK